MKVKINTIRSLLLVMFACTNILGSTGDFEGIITSYDTSNRSFNAKLIGVEYVSQGQYDGSTNVGDIVDIGAYHNSTILVIDGVRVTERTFEEAMAVGKRVYVHNSRSSPHTVAMYNTPAIPIGEITDINLSGNEITIHDILTDEDHPHDYIARDTNISFDQNTLIMYEGKKTDASSAFKSGRWARAYPARNQTFYSYTPRSRKLPRYLLKKNGIKYGKGNQSKKFLFKGIFGDSKYYYKFRTSDERILEHYDGGPDNEVIVNGQYMPSGAALRKNDEVISAYYTYSNNAKIAYVNKKDEGFIEGIIKEVNNSSVKITMKKWNGNKKDTVVDFKSNPDFYLNGNSSNQSNAIQKGNFVRIMEKRNKSILVTDKDKSKFSISKPEIEPYFYAEPENDTVFAGKDTAAQFEILDESQKLDEDKLGYFGEPMPEIQWYKNGQPISGETSEQLTHPLSSASKGDQFTAKLTSSLGTVRSNPAAIVYVDQTQPVWHEKFDTAQGISKDKGATAWEGGSVHSDSTLGMGNDFFKSEKISVTGLTYKVSAEVFGEDDYECYNNSDRIRVKYVLDKKDTNFLVKECGNIADNGDFKLFKDEFLSGHDTIQFIIETTNNVEFHYIDNLKISKYTLSADKNLSFEVIDQNQELIHNAEIIVENDTLSTNGKGKASITLTSGNYNYSVNKSGYKKANGSVELSEEGITKKITLEKTVTSNTDFKENKKPTVYPTVNTGTLHIKNAKSAIIKVFNVNGVLKQNTRLIHEKQKLDIHSLPAGMYLVHIITDNGKTVHKVIKK